MPTETPRRHLVQAYVTEVEYRSINQCGPYGQAILTSHNRYSDQPYSEDDFAAICRDAVLAAGHIQKLAEYDYPALEHRPTRWVRNPEFDVAAWSQRQPATAENVPEAP